MERIKNEVLFLRHGFDLRAYRARPQSELKALSESPSFRMQVAGGIAVIPIRGPINRGEGYYGETDMNDVASMCVRASTDPGISGVILKCDSPGGTASGCQGVSDCIGALAAVKPTIAHCDMCCSANYYLIAQTRKIYAAPDAMIGSIGTTTELVDTSKMYENMGVKIHQIDTGKFKGVGADGAPVTQEDIDYVQGIIDDLFAGFVKTVASGRKISQQKVRDMEAKVFIGAKAIDAGLIDGICSMESCIHALSKSALKNSGKSMAMARATLQLAQTKGRMFI